MKEPSKQEILNEITKLRAETETVKRKAKELGLATTRLYLRLDQLPPGGSKTTLKS